MVQFRAVDLRSDVRQELGLVRDWRNEALCWRNGGRELEHRSLFVVLSRIVRVFEECIENPADPERGFDHIRRVFDHIDSHRLQLDGKHIGSNFVRVAICSEHRRLLATALDLVVERLQVGFGDERVEKPLHELCIFFEGRPELGLVDL